MKNMNKKLHNDLILFITVHCLETSHPGFGVRPDGKVYSLNPLEPKQFYAFGVNLDFTGVDYKGNSIEGTLIANIHINTLGMYACTKVQHEPPILKYLLYVTTLMFPNAFIHLPLPTVFGIYPSQFLLLFFPFKILIMPNFCNDLQYT